MSTIMVNGIFSDLLQSELTKVNRSSLEAQTKHLIKCVKQSFILFNPVLQAKLSEKAFYSAD
jgi:hypothetical protein